MNENEEIQGDHRSSAADRGGGRAGNVNVYDKPERDTPPMGAILGIIALVVLLVLLILWIF